MHVHLDKSGQPVVNLQHRKQTSRQNMFSLLDIPPDRRKELAFRTSNFDFNLTKTNRLDLPKDNTSNCLYGNIFKSVNNNFIGIRIPRKNEYYTGTNISSRRMKQYLNNMEQDGLIKQFSGGFDYIEGERIDYCSVILFESKLKQLIRSFTKDNTVHLNTDVIHIRNRLNKERKSNKGIFSIKEKSNNIISLNKLMLDTEYKLNGNQLPIQQFKRIFTDSLDYGGRYYSTDGGIQLIPSSLRKMITVNGNDTVELDYKAMHPSIILELKNKEKSVEFKDPYAFVVPELDNKGLPFKLLRDYYKLALIIAINCKSFRSAEAALRKSYENEPKFHPLGQSYSGQVLKAAYEHNDQMREYFFSDMGIFLQNVDSQIMDALLKETTSKGIPVYPIHDSVMVAEKDSFQVTVMMKEAYEKVLGGNKFCFIDTKR